MRFNHPATVLAATITSVALTIASCGGSDAAEDADSGPALAEQTTTDDTAANEGESPSATEATVGIKQSRFDPTDVTIAVGGTVQFTNNDPFAHTVTAKEDQIVSFDSGDIGQNATFDVTFDEAGTFSYFCEIHPTMRATVTVA